MKKNKLLFRKLFPVWAILLISGNLFAYTAPTALRVLWTGADQTATCHQYGDYITNVTFAGINNTTAGSGAKAWHTDFGRTATQLAPGQVTIGQSYTISVTITGQDLQYDYLAVYVDWNQNNVNGVAAPNYSLESNENPLVWNGLTGSGAKTLTGTINVPSGIPTGQIYMRVMLDADTGGSNGGDFTCAIGFGEFQDYVLNVSSASVAPTITWSNPADIVYGTLLSATQLNATASVPGTFTYTPALGTKLDAGATQNLKVDFTPTDLVNYLATSKTVTINVDKATPVITWSNPADISSQTALGNTELNATANVAGTFIYTPALGTLLNVGSGQALNVDFTPTDAANYNTATKTVLINVFLGVGLEGGVDNKIIVYPNPVVDAFQVSGLEGMVTVSVTDLNGKVILSKQIPANEKVFINALPGGIYILKIKAIGGTIFRKVVKK